MVIWLWINFQSSAISAEEGCEEIEPTVLSGGLYACLASQKV